MLSGPQNHSGTGADVLYFDTPAGSEAVTERITLFGEYTVTDAGISSGENVAGYIEYFKIEGILKEKFGGGSVTIVHFRRNEILTYLRSLAPDDAISYVDADPTTAEVQGFGFGWDQHIDWSMLESASVELSLLAPTSEWGAASAMVFTAYVQFDEVPRSEEEYTVCKPRKSSASSTDHSIKVPDPGVMISADIEVGTANYLSDITVYGDETQKYFQVPKAIQLKPLWLRFYERYDANPSDDTITYLKLPPMLVPTNANRKIDLGLSTAAAVVVWPHLIVG